MMWITLISLGLLLAVLTAVTGLAVVNRRRAARMPGAFTCRIREREGRTWHRYPRLPATGWWVGGVLAVHGGLGLALTRMYPVAAADAVRPLRPGEVRGLGATPRSVLLILDDGRLLEVAVAAIEAPLLIAPVVPRQPSHRG